MSIDPNAEFYRCAAFIRDELIARKRRVDCVVYPEGLCILFSLTPALQDFEAFQDKARAWLNAIEAGAAELVAFEA